MTKDQQRRLTAWRWRLLTHASEGSRSVAQTCRHFGLSRKTFYKWKKRLTQDGVAALCDRPRTPLRSPGGSCARRTAPRIPDARHQSHDAHVRRTGRAAFAGPAKIGPAKSI